MNVGGPAKLLLSLADSMPNEEFVHILITGNCEKNEKDLLKETSIKSQIIYVPSLRRTPNLLSDIKAFFQIIVELRKISPDIVHTHMSKAGFLGRLATLFLKSKPRLVHTYHGHLNIGYFNIWKTSLIFFVENQLSKFTDSNIAVSADVMKVFEKKGVGKKENWLVINPGTEIIPFVKATTHTNFKENAFNIIWVGRFESVKDPLLAVEAFSEISKYDRWSFTFKMVGDGQLMQAARDLAVTRGLEINFTGWSPNVKELFLNSDILVFTSENEGFGMVVIEAAACGVICISTDSGGVRDFIENQNTGILSQSDPKAIAKHAIQLFQNKKNFERIRKNAIDRVSLDFSISKYVDKHVSHYKHLMQK
jgi:glycosyltransferase involved in cell wall biosynthesis